MHELGRGVFRFYAVVAFHAGDDPALKRTKGMKEGKCRFGCAFCLYPTLKGVMYDPSMHLLRDHVKTIEDCKKVEGRM